MFPVKYQSSYVFEITLILFLFTTLKCRLLKLREVTGEIMANNSSLVVSLR